MNEFKISLITVCYNAQNSISRCIESVIGQTFQNVEYIIIDGGSTDKTLDIIATYTDNIDILVSEPDKGIYDAFNKGIRLATGDVIGMLNADDFLAGIHVLSTIAAAFTRNHTDIVYADLDYVNIHGKTTRKWLSGAYQKGLFHWGWMPPHPTFYCKRTLFDQYGYYGLGYGTAADYELMLRFIHRNGVDPYYLQEVIVKMQTGGASNKNIGNRFKALCNDFKAMRSNHIKLPLLALAFKPLRKLKQFI